MQQIHKWLCFTYFILNISLLRGAVTLEQYEARTKLKGSYNEEERVFKASFPRTDIQVTIDDYHANPFMGLTTWAAFSQSQKDENECMVMGDFALYEDELQPTLKMLRKMNITVVAIHNHMTNEEPRVLFVHYWGVGKLEDLALSIKKVMIK